MLYSKHSFPFSKASLQTDAALQEEGQTSTFENLLKLSLKESFFAVRHDANNQGILYLWLLEIGKKKSSAAAPSFSRNGKAIKLIGGWTSIGKSR